MTPQQLRNSILQQAIEGKLVEQRPEEGTAEELYSQIQEEKKKLIAEKKIKKEKPLSEITDNEIPFDIPESWQWVRLGTILNQLTDGEHKTPKYQNNGVPFISVKNMSSGKLSFFDTKYISEETYLECKKRCSPEKGDILLSKVGTTGVPAIVDTDTKFSLFVSVALLKFSKNLYNKYLYWLLYSPIVQQQAKENTKGVGNKNWVLTKISETIIPLPPLAEQKRIVAKIEELQPFVDKYEKAYTALEEYNARFPEDMKKAILQQAIEGKLVEQRTEEGTAEELYAQIQEEKKKLIAEGKIKKEKPLPEITEEEIPFDIPESWKWVRFGDLSQRIQYGYNAPALPKGVVKFVRISDIQDNSINWESVPYCEVSEEDILQYKLEENDILFARTGGTVGKSYLVPKVPELSIFAGYLIRSQYGKGLEPKFIKFFMESSLYWEQLHNGVIATAQPNCNGKTLSKMILPLPPLAEQKRIVSKIEELLPCCDKLK